MTDISIIIISWNAINFLEKCIPSLYSKNKDLDFEVILIDNNSSDGTAEFVKEKYPQIKYVYNKENRGVAPARNQGFQIA